MNKNLLLLPVFGLLSLQGLQAQKKMFTMAEATNGLTTTLALQGIKQASWEPGTNKLYQVVRTDSGDVWISTKFPEKTIDTVLKLKDLNTKVYGKEKLMFMPAMKWLEQGTAYYIDGHEIKKGIMSGEGFLWSNWLTLPEKAENITVHKTGNVAYTIDNNLWFINNNKQTIRLTDDRDSNVINGQAVHRNEFGIDGGIFISPDGNYIAYYHMDQTMVADYPIVDWSVVPAKSKNIKYPMAGGTSHQVTLRVYSQVTGKTTIIKTDGPKDQYLTNVTWSPDERFIYIAVVSRSQNEMWLNQYEVYNGGLIKTLIQKTSPKYVEPLNPLTFVPGSSDKFIWMSQHDGYMHLYLCNTDGKVIKQLTKGEWIVNEIVGINKATNEIIITASKESPLEKHCYSVDIESGKVERIDKEPGWHTITTNDSGTYMLDVFSSKNVPKRTEVRATKGSFSYVLVEAPNTLADYARPEVQQVTLAASDGTPLYAKLVLPVGFDEHKKYPVIVYLYNGPHVQLVKNTFPESGNLWYEYMAQHGYIVFTMDGRGSSNRGLAFEQATFRRLGTIEMEDQLRGVEFLKAMPWVDTARMGVHGWSFGGFMTTSLMLRHPGVFKVAVAGGPVMDWKMYEIMYTERYMDTPQENPEGYETANLLTKVKNLKGKLMLIHGTDDATVVWQHSINFLKKAVDENVQVDYFVYPGYEHNVRGKDRVHLMQKITDYFDTYLK